MSSLSELNLTVAVRSRVKRLARYALRVGLIYPWVRQLFVVKGSGAPLGRVLTVGRQTLSLRPSEIKALREEFGINGAADTWVKREYADTFLRDTLRVKRIDSPDASAYEGVTVPHDLNLRVNEEFRQQYDMVIDGGSMEHIFNVPAVLANLMKMIRVGRRLLLGNPANNPCGRGFYQFSPEWAYRAFRAEHGFQVERAALVEGRYQSFELNQERQVLDVRGLENLGEWVLRSSCRPAMLLIQARKIRHVSDPFAVAPQQSDYVKVREGRDQRMGTRFSPVALLRGRGHLQRLPPSLLRKVRIAREIKSASRFSRRAYTPSK